MLPKRIASVSSFVTRLTGLAMLFAVSGPAQAHTTWANGRPVPAWVGKACCGPGDAHHLNPDQVHRVSEGYRIEGYPGLVYDAQVLPSEDGEYWAFYTASMGANGERVFTSIFCFFAPTLG